jgi:tRNA A37 threonylcarbamoyltransferase TsaD
VTPAGGVKVLALTSAGVRGGSEEWEYRVFQEGKSELEKIIKRPMSTKESQKVLDDFNFYKRGLEPRGEACMSLMVGTQASMAMTPETITEHFEAAHKKCFDMHEAGVEQLRQVSSGASNRPVTQVVVSGGAARHKMVQERLAKICKARKLKSPIFIENHEVATEYR